MWYPWALQMPGFRFTVIKFGPRSAIERLFADLTKRMTAFWNKFHGFYTKEEINQWILAFAGFRNLKKDAKCVKGALS